MSTDRPPTRPPIRPPTRLATRLALGALGRTADHLRGRARPWVLNHLITLRCNLECPFCYVSGPEQREFNRVRYPRKAELDTREVRAFYQELVDLRFLLAVIVGGEPLLRTDLEECLSVLRGRMFVSLFTNGWLLEERAELVRSATNLFVSLDAPDEEHDVVRDKEGSFRRAVAGIEAVRRRYPKIRLATNMTVTTKNAHRVREMIAFARDMGIVLSFQPPTYDGQFTLDDRPVRLSAEHRPDAAVVAEAFREIDAAARAGEAIVGTRSFFRQVIEDRPTYRCHYPAQVLGPVQSNGDVVGCTTSTTIGNVREAGARAVLESAAFRHNAEAGLRCPSGCRDWGIYDLSALYERRFTLADGGRYARAFTKRRRRLPVTAA